jgi:protoheme IX farnesyltransferase
MGQDDAESGTRPTRPSRLLLIIVLVLVLTLGLAAACMLPFVYGMSSWLYLVVAIGLSAGFCLYGFWLWRDYSDALARKTFRFSLIHLSVLFAALLVDHYLF